MAVLPTARSLVMDKASATGSELATLTGGHWSVGYLPARVVDGNLATANTQGLAIIDIGTTMEWFGYGQNEDIPLYRTAIAGYTIKATRASTSLVDKHVLSAGEMMAAETVSLAPFEPIVTYPSAQLSATNIDAVNGWKNGTSGHIHIADPFGMMTPSDLTVGPLTLFHAVWNAVKRASVVELFRGAGTTGGRLLAHASRFGAADEPYLLASKVGAGGHTTDEGIFWDMPNGGKDSKISLRLTVEEQVQVPFMLPTTIPGGGTRLTLPSMILFPVMCVLDGFQVSCGRSLNGG
jgi:hypothetical protein